MGSKPNGKPRSSPQNSIENQWLKRAQFKFYKETLLFGRLHDNFSNFQQEESFVTSNTFQKFTLAIKIIIFMVRGMFQTSGRESDNLFANYI